MDLLRFELGEDGRDIREEQDMTAFTANFSFRSVGLIDASMSKGKLDVRADNMTVVFMSLYRSRNVVLPLQLLHSRYIGLK